MCTWQDITNVLDPYFLVFFGLVAVAMVVVAFISWRATSEFERRAQRPVWRERALRRTFDHPDYDGISEQELRTTRYAWFVPVRRIFIIAFIAMLAYPLLSPTFCLNLKCAEPIGFLQPDLSCDNVPSGR